MWRSRPFILAILYLLFGNALLAAGQSASQPPSAQASSAIVAAGAGIGNSAISTALGNLANNSTALTQVISNGFSNLITALTNLLNPELQYSYGGSPPVYPTRTYAPKIVDMPTDKNNSTG